LASNDAGIVERVDERATCLGLDPSERGFTSLGARCTEHDFGAIVCNCVDLYGCRVLWHDDGGSGAPKACSERQCLGVISGRVRHNALRELFLAQ
jgi:hypothetical protein